MDFHHVVDRGQRGVPGPPGVLVRERRSGLQTPEDSREHVRQGSVPHDHLQDLGWEIGVKHRELKLIGGDWNMTFMNFQLGIVDPIDRYFSEGSNHQPGRHFEPQRSTNSGNMFGFEQRKWGKIEPTHLSAL